MLITLNARPFPQIETLPVQFANHLPYFAFEYRILQIERRASNNSNISNMHENIKYDVYKYIYAEGKKEEKKKQKEGMNERHR